VRVCHVVTQETFESDKCPMFSRLLRRALADLQLKDAIKQLDELESAAVADRTGMRVEQVYRPNCST